MSEKAGLGNSANWPRIFGRRGACSAKEQVAVTRGLRLFNKNIAGRKPERVSTAGDSCPVPVGEARVQPGQAPVNGGGNNNPLKVA